MTSIKHRHKFVCFSAQPACRLGNLGIGDGLRVVAIQALHASTARRVFLTGTVAREIHQCSGPVRRCFTQKFQRVQNSLLGRLTVLQHSDILVWNPHRTGYRFCALDVLYDSNKGLNIGPRVFADSNDECRPPAQLRRTSMNPSQANHNRQQATHGTPRQK